MKMVLTLALSTLTLAAMADVDQDQQVQKRALVVKDRIEVIERIDVTAEKPLVEVEDADQAVMAILDEVERLESGQSQSEQNED